ncbi:hypothetical protein LCGC14_1067230 [marine sediment metagenome]|uniref:Thioredoxin domain-containing protein n=1 Tax=marine sediment metagenome TaxID=412755 RepID=A0A0F9QQ32_9ZZZZ
MPKESTITIKKSNFWKYLTFVLIALFIVSLLFLYDRNNQSNVGPNQQPGAKGSIKVQIEDNDPILGNPDAEISIVEFSDFQCPFCGRAHTDALANFRQSSYFANGEVNLVYKQFPLNSIHPNAQKAGEASLCAQDQDKFWEYHDYLFENQNSLDTLSLKVYATKLGLDASTFNSCLDDGKYTSEVNKETAQAIAAGGRGTPYFVVINNGNGDTVVISGAVPWSNFETAISTLQ